jgi:predicted O-methyltransferase YrrM
MSIQHTLLTEPITHYVDSLFSHQNPQLDKVLIQAEYAGIPPISIGALQGSFLQTLIRATNTKYIIEIGSLAGYSAFTMAEVLPKDGMVHCFEVQKDYAEFIINQAEALKLSHTITVHVGEALQQLSVFSPEYPIDLVFIDADKPNYINYLEAILPFVKSGGIIIGDNALAWGYVADIEPDFEPENVKGIQSFNKVLSEHPLLYPPSLIPLGDGMAMAVKK